jgi:sulfite reductase (NADPH) flavoprotein alpha-component
MTKKLISEVAARQTNAQKKAKLEHLLSDDRRENLKNYLAVHEVWDLLEGNPEVTFSPQELCNLLLPLLPRFYSVASAPKVVGEEVHLTVAFFEYESEGEKRRGVCTHYLCNLVPMYESVVPVYVQPSNGFTLPSDPNVPIIMIGPGTGVAPYRGFMQERMHFSSRNWLFFGEWNRSYDFFYEDFWRELEFKKKLRMDLAFSRDQAHKIYVQHRMLEHAEEFFRWLEDGAYVYVCGDKKRMAPDVDAALHQIVKTCGNMDEAGAKAYVKKLRTDKRYLRDVY